ncbi:hypothetical protein CAPTEDRAFT_209215 [Capitella teleta]|uniref:Uncharacterized protein n=1 Tax=Capitella teleta TaxID=283909 RepID=R7VJ44_CAPTE|nr:hypothetical protein CAPTEDRAFT_209215 [Capitella teleta]|eukprot:ELU18659.1 hypothetical protein CAPTEDRAFT_209215 [Capitella teleta]
MSINESKTQFMVINGEEDDRNPIIHDDLNITNCDMFTYLGARFTQDGRLTLSVKAQIAAKMCHVVKFEAFVRRNPVAPFVLKKKVFEAALTSALLYGFETWLSATTLSNAARMYNSCVRSLLGVRTTTASDLSLTDFDPATGLNTKQDTRLRIQFMFAMSHTVTDIVHVQVKAGLIAEYNMRPLGILDSELGPDPVEASILVSVVLQPHITWLHQDAELRFDPK